MSNLGSDLPIRIKKFLAPELLVSWSVRSPTKSAFGLLTIPAIDQMPQQRPKRVDLAVNIAHDVERAVEQGLDERWHVVSL